MSPTLHVRTHEVTVLEGTAHHYDQTPRTTRPEGVAVTDSQLTELVDDAEVIRLRSTAYIFDDGDAIVLQGNSSPANASAAARLGLGADVSFSHLAHGCPDYRKVAS